MQVSDRQELTSFLVVHFSMVYSRRCETFLSWQHSVQRCVKSPNLFISQAWEYGLHSSLQYYKLSVIFHNETRKELLILFIHCLLPVLKFSSYISSKHIYFSLIMSCVLLSNLLFISSAQDVWTFLYRGILSTNLNRIKNKTSNSKESHR